jgi:CHAD domain-containing protein
MTRVFELVLDIPAAAAHDWAAARIHRRRDEQAAQPDASIVAALAALPAMKRRRRSEARLAVHGFDAKDMLGAAGWRLAIETSDVGRRVVAVHGKPYAPGITIRDAAFQMRLDVDAVADADATLNVLPATLFDSAPSSLTSILDEAGALERTVSFGCTRTRWSLPTHYAVPIDVVFVRIDALGDDAAPVREIHLTTPIPTDPPEGHDADAQRVLFELARDIAAALPAFAVLDGAVERASRGEAVHTHEPAHAAPVDLDGNATQRAALLAIGWNLAHHWLGNEAGVRDAASVEFVHQMRVAQRRLKTAMRLFRDWQDDAWTTRIAPGLKWLGDLLGDARDWDVFVDSTLPDLSAADGDAARWSATRDVADARRLALRAGVQQALASPRYALLVLEWLEWQGTLMQDNARVLPDSAGQTLRKHAKKRVRKAYEKLAAAPKLTTLDDASRHRERIRAKRLRYTLEFLAPLATKKTRVDVVKTLSRMQGVLGDGNDAAVALGFLEQLDVEAYQLGFARGWCEAAKRYTAREGERLLRQLDKPRLDG